MTILTTNIQTRYTIDVSQDNDTFNLRGKSLPENTQIAARDWFVVRDSDSDSRTEEQLIMLRSIFGLFAEKLPTLQFWCIIGDAYWRDDNRISRYYTLFKRLKKYGLEITHSAQSYEKMLERDGKIRYFSAVQLSELSIRSTVNVMAEEQHSYILAVPEGFDMRALLSQGWESPVRETPELLERVAKANGLLLQITGDFDDHEIGYIGFGTPETIRKLI